MLRHSLEGGALAQLVVDRLDDADGAFFAALRGDLDENLAQTILGLGGGLDVTIQSRLDLLVGNADARAIAAADQDLPGDFRFHLLAQRVDVDAARSQIVLDFLDRGAGARGDVGDGVIHLGFLDLKVEFRSLLKLQRFIHQAANGLVLDPRQHFLGRLNAG